jgi:hypothetical protein
MPSPEQGIDTGKYPTGQPTLDREAGGEEVMKMSGGYGWKAGRTFS